MNIDLNPNLPTTINDDALRLARDVESSDFARDLDRDTAALHDHSTTAVCSKRKYCRKANSGAALKQIRHRVSTIAQQIKAIIANTQWTADDLQALLPNPKIRVLSQWDFRAAVLASDLAWAAGFFDGEGCVSIVRQRYKDPTRQETYRLKIYVSQTNKRSLEEFEWIVGLRGRIVEQKATGKGRRSCYSLIYESLATAVVLRRLQPYLRRKRRQCEIALDFQMRCEIHTHFGPHGCPPHLWHLRRAFFDRMQTIKVDQ